MARVAVIFAAALVAAHAAGVGRGAEAAKPQLRVDGLRPLVVVGTGFHAGENVRVTASADEGRGARTAEAGGTHRISVRFAKLKLGRCSEYLISAKGDEGSRAALRSVPRPCGIDR
jgi:hypothetical protein